MNYDKENVLAQPVPPHPAASTAATATQPSAGEDQEYMYGEEDEQGTSKEAPCVVRGRKSWKYLKSIGLHASLVLVPDHKGQSAVAYANSTLGTAEANDCYDTQNSDFDLLMRARVTAKAKVGAKAWPIGAGPETDPGLIDLLGSTTVAMQMMQHLGYSEAQKILGYRLSGGAALGETAKSTAHAKVTALCEMIDGAKTATGGTPSGVLLFNYRLGEVNKQHNANKDILEQVCKVAADMGYVTIVIPQMSSGQYKTNLKGIEDKKGGGVYIFDLLDVKTPDAQFMDNTAKAYFWHLVASFMQGVRSPIGTAPINAAPVSALATGTRPPVIGLVDGRSGSTDLPAFVGLRVYSWEEPMLAALGDAAGPTASGAWTSMYYKIQGPQAMRLFNQYPIVVTGFLDLEGFTKHTGSKGRQYKKLNVADKTLTKWLDNTTTNPFPPLPQANPVWMRVRTSIPIQACGISLTDLFCRNSLQITDQRVRRWSQAASRSMSFQVFSPSGTMISQLAPPALVVAPCVAPAGRTRMWGLSLMKGRTL